MAFPVWRRNNKRVYVYYHDSNTNVLRQVPRKLTHALDDKPKEEVYAWIENWERENGKAVNRSARMHLNENDNLVTLLEDISRIQGVGRCKRSPCNHDRE